MEWHALEIGGGRVQALNPGTIRLQLPGLHKGYADAQIDDTQQLQRGDFLWNPPLHFQVQARSSPNTPLGTLGFGFWNEPFSLSLGQAGTARRLPAPPQAIWYFYGSDPNDLQFSARSGGPGWKAMALCSPRLPGLLTLPLGGIAIALAQLPILRRLILRLAQQSMRASETLLELDMSSWHSYEIFWEKDRARFHVDGTPVHSVSFAPSGPLGFVAWIDNQYLLASPKSGFKFGVLPTERPQWLDLKGLQIEPTP